MNNKSIIKILLLTTVLMGMLLLVHGNNAIAIRASNNTISDYLEYNATFLDVERVFVDNNSTHLIVKYVLGDRFPSSLSGCNYLMIDFSPFLYIDTDDNRMTGGLPIYYSWEWGAEYSYTLSPGYTHNCVCLNNNANTTNCTTSMLMSQIMYWNSSMPWNGGVSYGSQGYPGGTITLENNRELVFTIPLTAIGNPNDTIRIKGGTKIMVYDTMRPILFNRTLLERNITIDGDPSDWGVLPVMLNDTLDGYNIRQGSSFVNATLLYMSADNQYLYFLFVLKEAVPTYNVLQDYDVDLTMTMMISGRSPSPLTPIVPTYMMP